MEDKNCELLFEYLRSILYDCKVKSFDPERLDEPYQQLVGKVIWSSVLLGKIARLVSNPLIFIPVILVPLAIILLGNFFQTIALARKIAKEEEEKAIREAIDQLRKSREPDRQKTLEKSDGEGQMQEVTDKK